MEDQHLCRNVCSVYQLLIRGSIRAVDCYCLNRWMALDQIIPMHGTGILMKGRSPKRKDVNLEMKAQEK